jgi:hypothetical protein
MLQDKMRFNRAGFRLRFHAAIAAGFFFAGVWMTCGDQASVAPEMQGRWAGQARITVSWCQQTNLPVALDIHADGTVAGKVGDARLRSGWIEPNRGLLNHAFAARSDYIIHGLLKGPIVAAENITRPRVSIPLNVKNGVFVGSVETSGTLVGGKTNMILSAASLELTRSR